MNSKRTNAKRILNIRLFFEKFQILIEAHDIQNEDIYNMNETSFRLEYERDENVIFRCFINEKMNVVSTFNRTLVTVIKCIKTNEKIISLFVIMSKKKHIMN